MRCNPARKPQPSGFNIQPLWYTSANLHGFFGSCALAHTTTNSILPMDSPTTLSGKILPAGNNAAAASSSPRSILPTNWLPQPVAT
ncbi:Uncharacterised protein [Mycobacterium tuberculosis]|nr:Uncharacterised protein [Mycobacterium tuberculosis]